MGLNAGRATKRGRRVVSRYVQARTGKGNLGMWGLRLGRGYGLCRLCQNGMVETGDHLVFECEGTRSFIG